MLVLFTNPIELIHDLGGPLAAAALCTGLFIINSIQISRMHDHQQRSDGDMRAQFASLNKKLEDGLKRDAELISKLAEDQREFITSVARDNKEIATTLVNLTNSIDRVVSRLIEVIREVEKT